jgi:hypothetical protein
MRKFVARAALGVMPLVLAAAPARAADVDVAVQPIHYVGPVHRSYPYPPPVYYPRVYMAPAYVAAPHCYRSRRVHPNGTVVYRRVCV